MNWDRIEGNWKQFKGKVKHGVGQAHRRRPRPSSMAKKTNWSGRFRSATASRRTRPSAGWTPGAIAVLADEEVPVGHRTCRERRANTSGPVRTEAWVRPTRAPVIDPSAPNTFSSSYGCRDLELVVAAILGSLVRPPAQERRGMPEAIALQVVVLHLAHALDAQRLPRQVLARAPATLRARHPHHRAAHRELGPLAPRMAFERVLAQRRELLDQLLALDHRERRGHADVMEASFARRRVRAAATRRCPFRSCASESRRPRSRRCARA